MLDLDTPGARESTAAQTGISRIWDTGVLVQLEVHMWTGTAALDPADLGLPRIPEIYQLGRKRLVPKYLLRPIQTAAQRAYRTLEAYSVPFPVGTARFVSLQALPRLSDQLDLCRREFEQAVDRFIRAYRAAWADMEEEYLQAARAAYRVAAASNAVQRTEDEFVADYLQRIRNAYPDPEAARSKFSLSYHTYQITAPELRRLQSTELAVELHAAYRRQVEAFFELAVREIRERVAAACEEAAEVIRRGETVTQHTVQALRRMVAQFRALNFTDDHEVERMLARLEAQYLSAPARMLRETNAVPSLRATLDAIAQAARDPAAISRVTGELKRRIVID